MDWIDLGNPVPFDELQSYSPKVWSTGEVVRLVPPDKIVTPAFHDVAFNRRSRRHFSPISNDELSTLLWLTARTQDAETNSSKAITLRRTPVPSAGALHPVHIIIKGDSKTDWWLYDRDNHELRSLVETGDIFDPLLDQINQVVPRGAASVILLVAEPGKTMAKYKNACSLVWRDAGVLLAHFGLAAESIRLNFCALGITGEPWTSLLDDQNRLVGVGVALVGA
ncbi:MAG: nitroreductase family protein [Candidatus Melainabacteria bacterium]|nr:nitroreductase family protein [Candidatus Melainabacteria bacterium]